MPRPPFLGERLRLLLKLLVSLTLLWLLIAQVQSRDLAALIFAVSPNYMAAAFLATVIAWLINTYKWQQLLIVVGEKQPFARLLSLNYVGIFYSLVLPGQVSGEVVKGFRLAGQGVSSAHTLVTIGLDRLTGVLALGIVGAAGLLLAPAVDGTGPLALLAVAAVALTTGVLWLVAGRSPLPVNRLLTVRSLRRFQGTFESLRAAVGAFQGTPGVFLAAQLQAVLFQLLVTASNYLAALAVGVDIPLIALTWIVALVSLVHMAPISFGGLGVREGAYVFLLHQYGVPLANGLTLSLAVFALIFLQGVIGGIIEFLIVRRGYMPPRVA